MTLPPPMPWEAFLDRAPALKRIAITGAPGAGKTTVARELAAALNLPIIADDHHVMLRDWVFRPEPEQMALRNAAVAAPRWLLDGVDISLSATVLERVEAIIWLDLPLPIRLQRVIGRTYAHWGQTRDEHPDGNPERFDLRKLRFLAGMSLRAPAVRRRIARRIRRHDIDYIRLGSVHEAAEFSARISETFGAPA